VRLVAIVSALAAAVLAFAAPAAAQQLPGGETVVSAELRSERALIAPGESFTVVLRQTIADGWHTYWLNPGDAGEPTAIEWRLPAGFTAGPIQWPVPEALPFITLVNYGYSHEVLLPVTITAPTSLQPGESVTLSADASWVACADICILGRASVSITLQAATQGRDEPQWAARIADAVRALPRRAPGVEATIAQGDPARLSVVLPGAQELRNVRFFPFSRDAVEAAAAQSPRVGPRGVSFTLTAGVADNLGTVPLEGLVAYEAREAGEWVRRGVEIAAAPSDQVVAGVADSAAPFSPDYALAEIEAAAAPAGAAPGGALTTMALLGAIGLAFLGGLILNVMPCVLPVLSIKALAFAGGADAGQSRRQGVFYVLGVMTTFMALAALVIALREAGAAVGWGFQLQSPLLVAGLALLFFTIGLNLLGVFEIGGSAQNLGAGLAARGGDAGAFFTGALAVVAATPCTAPFLGLALGAALSQPAPAALLIFAAMAVGFALPLAALHFAPAFQRLIPKPGPWMERVRNVLAFPMFAAAVWLAWILTQQTGAGGVMALLSIAAALAFALYVGRWGRAWLAAGLIVLAATTALTWRPLAGLEAERVLAREDWSPMRVAELQAEGRGVFVNFTAAWCVTCKFNEALVFERPRVAQTFAETGTAYLVADWTNRNQEIAAVLDEHRWPGVPLYLYYAPGAERPAVIPIEGFGEAVVIGALRGEMQ